MANLYILINKINDMSYIGKTSRKLYERFKEHKRSNGQCSKLHAAIKKYGWNNFEKIFLMQVDDCLINIAEKAFIKYFKTISPSGYNLTAGGDGGTPSEETRKKLSQVQKGRVFSDEHKKKMSEAWKKRGGWTEETRAKFIKTRTGHKTSEETKRKIAEAQKGKHIPPEQRIKMSKAKQGCIPWNKGMKMTEEFRIKASERQKGKIPNNKGKTLDKQTMKFKEIEGVI